MDLHEYQAKQLLSEFDVPLLDGELAYTPREAEKAAVNLGGGVVVVKAQVHAGGRGKAGGVKLAKSPEEAFEMASSILGMTLVTPQTGAQGKLVQKVWVEEGCDIAKEFYLSVLVDRNTRSIAFIACAEGGTEIEELAEHSPEKVLTVPVKPESGLQAFHGRKIASHLGLDKGQSKQLSLLLSQLYTAFRALDCSMLEINPLVLTGDGDFVCLDAKMSIDDDALFRQRTAFEMIDYDEIDERELKAKQLGLSYIALEGNIGCMVNGAGLAMATMDIIKQAGGEPANFLDVGGGATKEKVTEAFKLILKDDSVKGILVNIFGGIMKCDIIAEGVIEAAKALKLEVPLVVRLEGTNVRKGKELLSKSGLKITPAEDMEDAAKKIVAAVK